MKWMYVNVYYVIYQQIEGKKSKYQIDWWINMHWIAIEYFVSMNLKEYGVIWLNQ